MEYFDVLLSIEIQKNCHLSNNTKFCVIQIQNNTKNNVLFDITHFYTRFFKVKICKQFPNYDEKCYLNIVSL